MDEAARARLEHEALKALHACRASLLGTHGFIATLAMQLELVPVWDFRMPTAATDALRIYVRPDWLLALSFEQRTFVLAHEVMHCAMLHFARTMTGDHRLWNIAWDHEVNDLLLADGMTPPESMVWFPERKGWSAEQVYNQLVDAEDGGPTERGPHCDVHLGQPIDGIERRGEGEPLEVDPRFTPELERSALDAWPHRVRGALNARGAGVGSAIEQRLINRTREAALPWRSMLAAFVTRAFSGSAQWLPPARRHVHRGVYLPSRRGERLKITVAVDTSGSTTWALPDFFAELAGIVAAFPRYELTLIACDDVIHSVEVFSEDRPLSVDTATLVGGGGTDLCPPFAWLAERAYDVDVMVYLTDGFGPAPDAAPAWPVLWVLVPNGRTPAPWADAVWMEAAPVHEVSEGLGSLAPT